MHPGFTGNTRLLRGMGISCFGGVVHRDTRGKGITLKHESSRREFCVQACGIAGFAALGGALSACGAGPGGASAPIPVVTATTGSGVVTLAIDASSPLAAVGGAALVRSSSG